MPNNSMAADNMKTGPDSGATGAASLGDEVLSGLVDHLGTVPPLKKYTNSESSLETFLKINKSLQNITAFHPYNDNQGREHRGHHGQECTAFSSLSTRQLPPELLSRIFVLRAQMAKPEGWARAARTCSRVCKRWRQIALDCPELWSLIYCHDYDHPRWLAKLVGRSGSFPLSIFGRPREWHKDTMALVVDNMHRFKLIDLCIPDQGYYDVESIFEAFSQSAPLLQDLTLSQSIPPPQDRILTSYRHQGPTHAFPPNFLGGCTPNLRHIRLFTTIHIPWNSRLFSNLTTLAINRPFCSEGFYESTSLEMLLAALTRMPRLEVLILRRCIPPTVQTAECAHVNLLNLKRLQLVGPVQCTMGFLTVITISDSATLIVNCEYRVITSGDIDKFVEVFSSRPWAAELPIRALDFTWAGNAFRVDAWPVQQHSEVTDPEIPSTILTFCSAHLDWPLDLAFPCFTVFASTHLRSFRISDNDITWKWDGDVWRTLARMAPGLQALAVGGPAHGVELCKVLHPPDGIDTAPEDCILPMLLRLDLTARHNHVMTTPDGGATQLSTVLARSLAMRAAIGCPTQELVFIIPPSEESAESWSEPFREAIPDITVREHHILGEGVMPA